MGCIKHAMMFEAQTVPRSAGLQDETGTSKAEEKEEGQGGRAEEEGLPSILSVEKVPILF